MFPIIHLESEREAVNAYIRCKNLSEADVFGWLKMYGVLDYDEIESRHDCVYETYSGFVNALWIGQFIEVMPIHDLIRGPQANSER